MADDNIDKALPNVEQQVTLPGEEEIVEAQETIEESLPCLLYTSPSPRDS